MLSKPREIGKKLWSILYMNKRKKIIYAFSVIGPGYYLYKTGCNKNEFETIRNNNDIEKLKNLNINNICSYVPLLILNIYDNYIYKNKILKKIYFKYKKRSNKKNYNDIKNILDQSDTTINYDFIYNEKSIFNKLYIYELVLEKSIKYAILSPKLSIHILKELSSYFVNLNPKLYNEKDFSIHTKIEKNKRQKIIRSIFNCFPKYRHSENSTIYYSGDANSKNIKKNEKKFREPYEDIIKNGNVYEKYDIHKFEKAYQIDPNMNNGYDVVTLNLLYLINKIYDNANRVCLNTNTNIYINFYVINILKYICYKHYRNMLKNHAHLEDLINGNKKKTAYDYIYAFFFKNNNTKYSEIKDSDKSLFCFDSENYLNNLKDQINNESTHFANNESCYMNEHGLNEKGEKKEATSNNFEKIVLENPEHASEIKIMNDLYLVLYLRLLFESSIKILSIKKNISILEKKQKFDKDHQIIYMNPADSINNLKTNFLKRFRKNENKKAQTIFLRPYSEFGMWGLAKADRKNKEISNYQENIKNAEKKSITNKDNVNPFLYYLLQCKNVLSLDTKTDNIKNNTYANVSIDEQNNKITKKKISFIPSFFFFSSTPPSYTNCFISSESNGKDNENSSGFYLSPFLKNTKIIRFFSDTLTKVEMQKKKMKTYLEIKIFKVKRNINYYIFNLDQVLINKYYNLIHKRNINKINTHLNRSKEKDVDINKFNDMYTSMIKNLHNIFSFVYLIDEHPGVYKIVSLYSTNVFYEYNYLNENQNMFYTNCINKYLYYFNNNLLYKFCFTNNSVGHDNKKSEKKNRKKKEKKKEKKRGKNYEQAFFYCKNDINLLLFLYSQRIKSCFYIFSYIFNKYNLKTNYHLNYIYYKLNYLILFPTKNYLLFFILNFPYLAYNNLFTCFSFLYFLCTYSYLFLFLVYQSYTFSNLHYFRILSDQGIYIYLHTLYNNFRNI
ncbi:conserved Plasmodium protein, unknown function [Plasmodium chabaudi adami]|uniref:Uncharacterized protein n=1 Tax=Plasmodium chabaudi adami TaxID=5826 RepID=A0A1D3LG66_PLACE|nr:conserved Plasmodium protein, unknown function [Plasmodium chabaudi adami]